MTLSLPTLFDRCSPTDDIRPMTDDETKLLIKIFSMVYQGGRENFPFTKGKDLESLFLNDGGFLLGVMVKRLAVMTPELYYDPLVLLFCSTMCKSPGEIVMWSYALAKRTASLGAGNLAIDINILAKDLMPFGIPTESAMESLWREQKEPPNPDRRDSDNRLDNEAWI